MQKYEIILFAEPTFNLPDSITFISFLMAFPGDSLLFFGTMCNLYIRNSSTQLTDFEITYVPCSITSIPLMLKFLWWDAGKNIEKLLYFLLTVHV